MKFEKRPASTDERVHPFGQFTGAELMATDQEEGCYLPPFFHESFVEWAKSAKPRECFHVHDGTYWQAV